MASAFKHLGSGPLAEVYQQLNRLDQAGLAPLQALSKVRNAAAQDRIDATRRHLEGGHSLARAGRKAGLFMGFDAALMQAAEQTGLYPFAQLAKRHEARDRRRRKLLSRLWLPLGILAVALMVRPLPALIGGQLGPGGYLLHSLGLFLALLAGGALLWRLPGLLRQRWHGFDTLALELPLLGRLIRRRNSLEFARGLGLLLQAGLPAFDALPKAIGLVANRRLRARLTKAEAALQAGEPLSQALKAAPDLDYSLLALAETGEYAGSLDAMLLHYAKLEEEKVEDLEDALAQWLPRLVYFAVAIWMASSILSAGPPGSLEALRELEGRSR